jgi:uncharacterized protein YbjQ (UPF0145 family)
MYSRSLSITAVRRYSSVSAATRSLAPSVRVVLALAIALSAASAAHARDTDYKLRVDDVLQNAEYKARLGDDVSFSFGNQRAVGGESLGEYVANEKTNSFGKSDETACRWAMLSALLKLKQRAKQLGGDAVVNIVSYYKKAEFSSPTEFDCHAGALVAGVALKGTVVKGRAPETAAKAKTTPPPAPAKANASTAGTRPGGSKATTSGDGGVLGLGVMQ